MFIYICLFVYWATMVTQMIENLLAMQEIQVQSLGWENTQEKGMATHSSILGLSWWLRWFAYY